MKHGLQLWCVLSILLLGFAVHVNVWQSIHTSAAIEATRVLAGGTTSNQCRNDLDQIEQHLGQIQDYWIEEVYVQALFTPAGVRLTVRRGDSKQPWGESIYFHMGRCTNVFSEGYRPRRGDSP